MFPFVTNHSRKEDSGEEYSTDSSSALRLPHRVKVIVWSLKDPPRQEVATMERIPTNLRSVNGMKKHINILLKGLDFDYNLSVWMLTAALSLQGDYLEGVMRLERE